MFAATVNNTKKLMNYMLKCETFDSFLLITAETVTFASFSISGLRSNDHAAGCLWRDIKPYIYEAVRGRSLPKYMKIVLAAPPELAEIFSQNGESFFINIIYSNYTTMITTGIFSREFTLSRISQIRWEEYIKAFLIEKNIHFAEVR